VVMPLDIHKPAFSELNGVWLTTRPSPHGNGLEGASIDKKAVRVEVKIPTTDRRLVRWKKWALKRCTAETYHKFSTWDGSADWWVYFGVIPPSEFITVAMRRED
jgi:hypothetical protein